MQDQKGAWDSFYGQNNRPWRGSSSLPELPFPNGGNILEIGCGNGKTVAALLDSGLRVTGVDFSNNAIDMCVKNIGDRAKFICSSALDLPFIDSSFDGVVMFHVLEHFDDEEMKKALSEVKRVLKNNSHILIRAFSNDDMRSDKGEKIGESTVVRGNGIRYRYFSENELCQIFKEFEICSIKTINERTRFGESRSRIEADLILRI